MGITEKCYSFFKPQLVTSILPNDPITCNFIKGVLVFVALTGTSAYYSLKFAEFCSTLPKIQLKTGFNINNVTHTNATELFNDIDKIKGFINWFNHLEPYDICFYSAFGTAASLALIFSMAATNLLMLSHLELKKKSKEGADDSFCDCIKKKLKVEHEDHDYSALLSPSKKGSPPPRLNLSNISLNS